MRSNPEGERAREGGGEGEEEEGGGRALRAIPAADRTAFVQIGVASSELQVGASILQAQGVERAKDTQSLKQLLPRVDALHPRDARLRRLRVQALAAMHAAIAARNRSGPARSSAPATLAATQRIVAGLRRYQQSHPAIGGLVPD